MYYFSSVRALCFDCGLVKFFSVELCGSTAIFLLRISRRAVVLFKENSLKIMNNIDVFSKIKFMCIFLFVRHCYQALIVSKTIDSLFTAFELPPSCMDLSCSHVQLVSS